MPKGSNVSSGFGQLTESMDYFSASSPLLRRCSNYEFFNLSETGDSGYDDGVAATGRDKAFSTGSFLTLKRVERDFLRLLRNVIGDHERTPAHHSAYPFSQVRCRESNIYLCCNNPRLQCRGQLHRAGSNTDRRGLY